MSSGTNTKRNWGWVVVVAFQNYCIWYAMNGIVIFISILVSLNQLIRLWTRITITPCSTLHTIVSLMRFVVKHLFLLFSFSCLINFIFLYLLLWMRFQVGHFFHFQTRNSRWVSMKNKLSKQSAASINGSNQWHNSTYCFNADTDVSRFIQRPYFRASVMETYNNKKFKLWLLSSMKMVKSIAYKSQIEHFWLWITWKLFA